MGYLWNRRSVGDAVLQKLYVAINILYILYTTASPASLFVGQLRLRGATSRCHDFGGPLSCADPPPVVVKPADVSVMPGRTAVLQCVAHSTVEFNVTWLRYNETLDQYTRLVTDGNATSAVQTFHNGTLVIRCAFRS